ncbi:isopenicillin N synthase family dioxygenase [Roseomonas populi]|uniref:2-oxoglutarate-dependent ethylene/succinate-forming enzyme n=1 Tax=Roseomonas populi TaxID=3121582 RepID=A0ABT1X9Z0_9PROT|nr:2-oxoglutarate and iron-dependent oxygenase domain-containing protein [Roseomonas pecuniae]MCR0984921.1 isopenicillin N synthase family oxygenase [Roseomonas pecuniae]
MTDASRLAAFDAVPVIDIASAEDPAQRPALARRMTRAAEEVGFIYITGHANSPQQLDAVFDQGRAFFDLPDDEKRRVDLRKSPHFRGYLGLLERGNDPTFKGNYLEAFHVAQDLPPDHPDVGARMPLRGPNLWPAEPVGFRQVVYSYFLNTYGVGITLLELFAEGMGLPTDFFTRHYARSIAQLRLLRYPQQDDPSVELLARAHRDTGVITLLYQDDTGGLEVENKAGEWIAAPPMRGAYIINIGNTLQFWSGGRLTSTNHRVRNRGSGAPRYSLPFFMTPDYDTAVRAIGTEGDADAPSFHVGDQMLRTYRRIWPSVA